jgi:hypothetical protein
VSNADKVRIREISQAALAGILANSAFFHYLMTKAKEPGQGGFPDNAAKLAVEYAVALVKEQDKIS